VDLVFRQRVDGVGTPPVTTPPLDRSMAMDFLSAITWAKRDRRLPCIPDDDGVGPHDGNRLHPYAVDSNGDPLK